MGDSNLELQHAVFAKLKADATLAGMVKGVYDYVPEKAEFPYVTLGEVTSTPWDSYSHSGMDSAFTVHSWSTAKGHVEIKKIMDRIYDIFRAPALSVADHHVSLLKFDFSQTLSSEEDEANYHGIQRFRALIREA